MANWTLTNSTHRLHQIANEVRTGADAVNLAIRKLSWLETGQEEALRQASKPCGTLKDSRKRTHEESIMDLDQTQYNMVEERQYYMKKLLNSGEFSDLAIVCGRREFKVHKNIVCPQWPFLAAAMKHGFQESATSTVSLPDDRPSVVMAILQFLYYGHYHLCFDRSAVEKRVGNNKNSLCFHARVYAIADKYQLMTLKDLACASLEQEGDMYWGQGDCAPRIFKHGWFLRAAEIVYDSTPTTDRGLRDVMCRLVLTHADAIFRKPYTHQLLRRIPELAADMALWEFQARASPVTHKHINDFRAYECDEAEPVVHPMELDEEWEEDGEEDTDVDVSDLEDSMDSDDSE